MTTAETTELETPVERALCTIFTRGPDRYALRAAEVYKVFVPGSINRLPRLPPAVMGITQHRGRIVTVLDLAHVYPREGIVERAVPGPNSRILVLERAHRHLGLYVDAVDQIANIRLQGEPDAQGLRLISHQSGALCALDGESLAQRLLDLPGTERA